MTVTVHPHEADSIDAALLARWRKIPVAVIVDLAPECQVDPAIRPLLPPGRQPALFGRALTALCEPPDFGAVLVALSRARAGDVLVIDAGGHAGNAMIGDVLGGELHRRGAAGIVCDGPIRDVHELSGMDGLSVYSRSVNPRGPVGASAGAVNGRVVIGGCAVSAGDLVIGDGDGLAVLSPSALMRLIEPAEAKMALEDVWRARLASGETPENIFGLD
jgi:4-hydroxy-4-methyl-2-oxoglutarate aldolase